MALAFHFPALPASPTGSPRRGRAVATIRQAARAALVRAKQVGQAIVVLGIFAVMLVAAMAVGVLIWVPHFHVNG